MSQEKRAGEPRLPADQHSPLPETSEPARPAPETEETAPAAAESSPLIDEGPPPEPVDEIQKALLEAAQQGLATDVEFDQLAAPGPKPDDIPEDEVEAALRQAAAAGLSPEVDFEVLPAPSVAAPPGERPTPPAKAAPEAQPHPEPEPKPQPAPRPEPDPLPVVSDVWLILALFVMFRWLTLLLLRPGGFIRDWSDFDTYFGIAALSDYGLFPFLDFWLEWPPLVPWLAVGAYKLSLYIPPWPDDPRLWFILILGSVFVLFEVGNFWLIYRLARRLFRAPATISRALWMYALLFPPVYATLGFFDGVALFFILLALDFLVQDRRFLSAAAVGVGIVVKLIPGLMLPVAARHLWHRYRHTNREAGIEIGLYAVICGLVVLLLLAPFLLGGPQWLLTSFRSMLGRASWETVWALLEGYYGFGVVLGDRLNPAETNFAVHDGWLPWWLISLIFLGLYALIFTRPADYSQPRNLVAFTGLTIVFFLIYSKGYSPQFLVYLLPFILLLLPTGRGLTYALILTGLNVLEQPLYFVLLPTEVWLLALAVIGRLVLLLTLGLEFSLVLWPALKNRSILAQTQRWAPTALGGLAALALLALIPATVLAYSSNQINNTPLGTFTKFMALQAQNDGAAPPRLLLSEQATYRQIYPYLNDRFDVQLTDGLSKGFTGAPALPDLLAGRSRVWVLPTGPQQQALVNSVRTWGTELAAYYFEELGTITLYSFEQNPLPRLAPARFIGGIELLGHDIQVQAEAVTVTLFWRARNAQNQNLTVFTQLLNEAGELVAGHDGIPRQGAAPVTSWSVDAVQADSHRISLPPDLPPGSYTVVVGLYNDSDERVRGIDPEGFGFTNQAVPLEILQFQ